MTSKILHHYLVKINTISSGDEYDTETMSTDMLEDIRDRSQFYPCINRKEARYRISCRIKQRQAVWKGDLLSTRNIGKGSHKLFKTDFIDISQTLPIVGESG